MRMSVIVAFAAVDDGEGGSRCVEKFLRGGIMRTMMADLKDVHIHQAGIICQHISNCFLFRVALEQELCTAVSGKQHDARIVGVAILAGLRVQDRKTDAAEVKRISIRHIDCGNIIFFNCAEHLFIGFCCRYKIGHIDCAYGNLVQHSRHGANVVGMRMRSYHGIERLIPSAESVSRIRPASSLSPRVDQQGMPIRRQEYHTVGISGIDHIEQQIIVIPGTKFGDVRRRRR